MVNVASSVSYTDVSTPLEVDATPNTTGTLSPEELLPQVDPKWLPNAMRKMAETVMVSQQVISSMAVMACVLTANACVIGKYIINQRSWREEWPSLYCLLFAPSGSRKSAVFKVVTKPIEMWQRHKRKDMMCDYRTALSALKSAQKVLDRTTHNAEEGDPDAQAELATGDLQQAVSDAEEAVPVLPDLLVQDATAEALEVRASKHYERLFSADAEGGALKNATGQKWNKPPSFTYYLKAYSGDYHRVDRSTAGPRQKIELHQPALSILWMCQPSLIDELRQYESMRNEGLWNRMMFVVLPSNKKNLKPSNEVPDLDPAVVERWRQIIWVMCSAEHDGIDEAGLPQQHILDLTDEAHAVALDYEASCIARMQEGAELEEIDEFLMKAHGMLLRNASTLQLVERADQLITKAGDYLKVNPDDLWDCEIDEQWMVSAVEIMKVMEPQFLYVMGDHWKKESDANHVLSWIEKLGGTTTLRELGKTITKRLRKNDLIQPLLDVLEERGDITTSHGSKGTVHVKKT